MSTETRSLICTFYLNNTLYGIEIEHVQEVGQLTSIVPVPLAPPTIRGLVNLRGQIITVLDLHRLLELQPTVLELQPTEGTPDILPNPPDASTNMIVRWNHEALGLVVDRIGEVIEIDPAKVEPVPSNVMSTQASSLTGIYTLSSQILHLLNLDALSNLSTQ